MLKFKRIELFSRLSQPCYQCLESATLLCKTRGNPYVEIVHLLNQLQLSKGTAYHAVVSHFNLNEERLSRDLVQAMERLPSGANGVMNFADSIELMIKDAFMASSLIYKSPRINSAHLLLALRTNDSLNQSLLKISLEFNKIDAAVLQEQCAAITADSEEVKELSAIQSSSTAPTAFSASGQQMLDGDNVLQQYTVDLTARAAEGKIDEIWGRDLELYKVIDVLLRRRQNNPILTGEAGVGKTAVAEAFALRLARNQVPDALKGCRLLSLDLALLQAGASMKGEFEKRLKDVITAVKESSTPIILFIDEAHTLIGAGGQAGQNDAANLLKPALARGELRCIAATTVKEYARYFEKDPALSRRFENILIEEPSLDNACAMLHAIKGSLEQHHHVKILDEAVTAAVKLSSRYIPARQLPDKAVSVLDTACAKTALSQSTMPSSIEYLQQQIKSMELSISILEQESSIYIDHTSQLKALHEQLADLKQQLEGKQEKYTKCKELFLRYQDLMSQLSAQASSLSQPAQSQQEPTQDQQAPAPSQQGPAQSQVDTPAEPMDTPAEPNAVNANSTNAVNANSTAEPEVVNGGAVNEVNANGTIELNTVPKTNGANVTQDEAKVTQANNAANTEHNEHTEQLRQQLQSLRAELNELQADDTLILPEVNEQAVSTVISEWTGIPLGRMVKNEITSLLGLEDALKSHVIGQDHAIAIIAQRMLTSRASLADPSRPIAVLMLAGPSGVGKTETAHALAEELYGTDDNLITINMSEFQESHTVSTLKGAPPGYVGYGEGGVLTEAVRRRPYSVVLLDEIEKAHKDVHEIFFQIFDKGEMEDGEGRHVNFKNCVIILTTNVGTEAVLNACRDCDESNLPDPEKLSKQLHDSLVEVFPEALLGRLQVIAYYPLLKQALRRIVTLKLNKVVKRMAEQHDITLQFKDSLYDEIIQRCDNVGAGARLLDGIINNDILPTLSLKLLENMLEGRKLTKIEVGAAAHQYVFDFT